MILVVDASAMVDALIGTLDGATDALMVEIERNDIVAPHLIDLEVLNVLRRLESRKALSEDEADRARDAFGRMNIMRYATHGLANRIWKLRHNLTCYDAAYVALAEVLDAPLLTCDAEMAKAGGHEAVIRNFGG